MDVAYDRTPTVEISPRILTESRVVAGFDGRPEADVYRMLRTQVLQRLARFEGRTLAVCSAQSGAGKSVTAVNLAISLSMDVNQTVLLVDLDLKSPSIHSLLGLAPEYGLEGYLAGACDIADCLVNPGMNRMVVLPTLAPIDRSSEVLASPRMTSLARELRERYPDRLIVYDLPPLLASDDSLVFMQHIDAMLLVVEHGATRRQDIERVLGLMEGTKLIGTVLNKAQGALSGIGDHGYPSG